MKKYDDVNFHAISFSWKVC